MANKTMELANAWVELNPDTKSNIQKKNITPAEAIVIRKQFGVSIEGESTPHTPFHHIDTSLKPVERTAQEEYERLVRIYGTRLIKDVFPGENPNIPFTFKDANIVAQNDEPEPKKGKAQEIIPLTKLPVSEVTDEDSVKENVLRAAQQGQIDLLVKQNTELTATVTKLLAAITAQQPKQ